MMPEKYTITLADGEKLTGLMVNGSNFVSESKIDESIFAGNLSTMTVSGGVKETILHDAELIQQVHYPEANPPGWYLCFREKTSREQLEKKIAALQSQLDALLGVSE